MLVLDLPHLFPFPQLLSVHLPSINHMSISYNNHSGFDELNQHSLLIVIKFHDTFEERFSMIIGLDVSVMAFNVFFILGYLSFLGSFLVLEYNKNSSCWPARKVILEMDALFAIGQFVSV